MPKNKKTAVYNLLILKCCRMNPWKNLITQQNINDFNQ